MTKEKNQPEKELTQEEGIQLRANMIKYYEDQLTVLKPQHEYEKLIAEIDEFRFRSVLAMAKHAQLMQGPTDDPKKPRELKKE